MSKYDSEEWTSALSHFVGWTDHDPNVEETLRTLVASQQLAGVAETADVQSSLLRSQIDDTILKAMQAAKDEAGRDAYDYKDVPTQQESGMVAGGAADSGGGSSSQQHPYSAQDRNNSFGMQSSIASKGTVAWQDESHLRSVLESKKRTINDTSWSNHPQHPPYPHQYPQHPSYGPPPPGYGHQGYDGNTSMNGSHHYYPSGQHQYDGYQYHPGSHPPPPHHHMGGGYHHHGDMQYNDQYGHQHQYYNNGYYHQPSDGSSHGSFHEGMVFDHSMHSQDPYMHSSAHTPTRYHPGNDMHHGGHGHGHGQYPPASPYWNHLNISQLPGLVASPSMHITPSKPPRGAHNNRSNRKWRSNYQQGKAGPAIDGKAKSLIMFPNQTNSPASRFVMSPQDKSNPYYKAKDSPAETVPNGNNGQAQASMNQGVGVDESFVLPTIENLPESPDAANTSLPKSNISMDLMPPDINKKTNRRQEAKLTEVSEN